ncbi:hypothetical protein B0H13DRAFT_2332984 [Mycena leptocephala]|nr:hypothetical protein B0H13DRAFT_2332984 [Mycena leptocephala]
MGSYLPFFLHHDMPPARRLRRFPSRHPQRSRPAEGQNTGDASVYQGPDWPSFVIIPKGPDNPGGWQSAQGWNHPGESQISLVLDIPR